MLRRNFTLALASLGLAAGALHAESTARGPLFWRAKRGRSCVYLLGFDVARDRSWFTPTIQGAFEESDELWTEIGPTSTGQSPTQLYDKSGIDPDVNFFDALEPSVRKKALAYVTELGIERSAIEHCKPWRAYYLLVSAYSTKKGPALRVARDYPDFALLGLAAKSGKGMRYERPTFEAFVQFLDSLSAKAQSQYVDWLLDYFDSDKAGLTAASLDWANGKPNSASLDRMRRLPELYEVMQPRRNAWWANQIEELLGVGGTCFVAVGTLHVLGPDGIPGQLRRRGVDLEESAAFARNSLQ